MAGTWTKPKICANPFGATPGGPIAPTSTTHGMDGVVEQVTGNFWSIVWTMQAGLSRQHKNHTIVACCSPAIGLQGQHFHVVILVLSHSHQKLVSTCTSSGDDRH